MLGDNIAITSMVVFFMLYPAVSSQVFELFSCRKLYGDQYLRVSVLAILRYLNAHRTRTLSKCVAP